MKQKAIDLGICVEPAHTNELVGREESITRIGDVLFYVSGCGLCVDKKVKELCGPSACHLRSRRGGM